MSRRIQDKNSKSAQPSGRPFPLQRKSLRLKTERLVRPAMNVIVTCRHLLQTCSVTGILLQRSQVQGVQVQMSSGVRAAGTSLLWTAGRSATGTCKHF